MVDKDNIGGYKPTLLLLLNTYPKYCCYILRCNIENMDRTDVKHQKWEAHSHRFTVNTSASGTEPSSTLLAHTVILLL